MFAFMRSFWQRLPAWEDSPANRVTIFRLVLGTIVAHTLLGLGQPWWGIVAYGIAAFCDCVDGWLARRTKCTEWGAFMDPVTDKALVDSALFLVVRYFEYADWCYVPFLIIVAYDLMVMLMRVFDDKMKTSITAKRKQAVLFAGVGVLLLAVISKESIPLTEFTVQTMRLEVPLRISFTTVGAVILWISAALIIRSAWVYTKTFLLPRLWTVASGLSRVRLW